MEQILEASARNYRVTILEMKDALLEDVAKARAIAQEEKKERCVITVSHSVKIDVMKGTVVDVVSHGVKDKLRTEWKYDDHPQLPFGEEPEDG